MTALALERPKKPPRSPHRDLRATFLDSTEVYLRAIHELTEEDGLEPSRISLCRRMEITRSAVSQLVERMAREGLLDVSHGRRVSLTPTGRAAAAAVVRRHRLAERLLADIVGLEWELCHVEATRWQHVLGDGVARRLVDLLDDPTTSPYGDPIPGTAALRSAVRTAPLTDATAAGVRRARVRRIHDRLQDRPDVLRGLRLAGVLPGAVVGIGQHRDGTVRVASDTGDIAVDAVTGRSIVVAPEPDRVR